MDAEAEAQVLARPCAVDDEGVGVVDGLLVAVALAFGTILTSGALNETSVLREYANRADEFWREAQVHIGLALGSLMAATVVGIPLGILCDRVPPVRTAILNTLNAVQTIPSIALFGLLIAPLLWGLFATLPRIEFHSGGFGLVVAGALVGIGTRYGSGCTSGHGVCGISRLSPRSMLATACFMLSGFCTVFVLRHLTGV